MPAFIKSTTGPRVSRLISQSIKNDFRKFLQEISRKGKFHFLNKITEIKDRVRSSASVTLALFANLTPTKLPLFTDHSR